MTQIQKLEFVAFIKQVYADQKATWSKPVINMMKRGCCHDCGAIEGQIHELGCDMERCPFCGRQLITCSCAYKLLGQRFGWIYDNQEPFSGLPESVYNEGLTLEQERYWLDILNKKGRIAYIRYPNVCCRCGKLYPDMFMVADEEWKRYIEPYERGNMLCATCYAFVVMVTDMEIAE